MIRLPTQLTFVRHVRAYHLVYALASFSIDSFVGDERRRKHGTCRCRASSTLERSNTATEGEREREGERRRQKNTETKTAARRRRRGTTVRGGLSLGRLSFRERIAQWCRAHCCCHDKRRPFSHTASADTRTAWNVTRENPTRRACAKRVEKPRNDDINTHRRPPPPLGHGQYGVPLGLAAGKPAGWQEWNARLGLVRRPPRDVTVRKLARPSVTRYSTARTTPSCTVDIWLFLGSVR